MRNLTATLCLTIAVLVGSMGMSASGDYATALRELQPLAEQGHAPAQSGLGMMYFQGTGVSKDYKTAVKWFRHAA